MLRPTRRSYNPSAASASAAKAEASAARSKVEKLEGDVERLLMITEALWLFIKREHNYNDKQLMEVIAKIDMKDGRMDGRVSIKAPPQKCPGCRRVLPKRQPKCMFCGELVLRHPFER